MLKINVLACDDINETLAEVSKFARRNTDEILSADPDQSLTELLTAAKRAVKKLINADSDDFNKLRKKALKAIKRLKIDSV